MPKALQYCLALSVPSQATVLEEMPPFPERESSILAKLKKKKGPGNLPDIDDARRNVNGSTEHSENTEDTKKVTVIGSLEIWSVQFEIFLYKSLYRTFLQFVYIYVNP